MSPLKSRTPSPTRPMPDPCRFGMATKALLDNNPREEVDRMALTQTEFEALLSNATKRIEGDIAW